MPFSHRLLAIVLIVIGTMAGIVSSAQAEVRSIERQEDIDQLINEVRFGVVVSFELGGRQGWKDAVDEAVAASVATLPRPVIQVQQATSNPAVVGECTGFAVPDSIIQRESRGNPGAENPSGAFGCTQIMPFWWNQEDYPNRPGCADLDKYTVSGQRECTRRIVDYSGLSAWS